MPYSRLKIRVSCSLISAVLIQFSYACSVWAYDRDQALPPPDPSVRKWTIDASQLGGADDDQTYKENYERSFQAEIEKIPESAEYIDLYCQTWDEDYCKPLLRFKKLKRLQIGGSEDRIPKDLDILSVLPIEYLFLRAEYGRVPLGKMLSKFKTLKMLNLSVDLDKVSCSDLAKLPNLEYFRGGRPKGNLSTLRKCPSLKQLDASPEAYKDLIQISKISQLEKLCMTGWFDLTSGRHYSGYKCTKGLNAIAKMPSLKGLDISGLDLNDEHMHTIAGIKTLERLNVSGTCITDKGLAELSNLPNLKALKLCKTEISDEGIAALAKATQLEELDVLGTKTNGSFLKYLGTCGLRKLTMSAIVNANLKYLKTVPTIEYLDLQAANVCAPGAKEIAALPNLQLLAIGNLSEAEQSLSFLSKAPSLRHASIAQLDGKYFSETNDTLSSQLPNCKLESRPRDLQDYCEILIHGWHEHTESWTCF